MLVINDLSDLKKYIETRAEMIARQFATNEYGREWQKGASYAFSQCLEAIDSLLKDSEKVCKG